MTVVNTVCVSENVRMFPSCCDMLRFSLNTHIMLEILDFTVSF